MTVYRDIAVVLDRAADLIAARGKAIMAYRNADGCLCVVGAIRAALGCHPDKPAPHESGYYRVHDFLAAYLYLNQLTLTQRGGLLQWSDGHDEHHVIAHLRACAASARSPLRRRYDTLLTSAASADVAADTATPAVVAATVDGPAVTDPQDAAGPSTHGTPVRVGAYTLSGAQARDASPAAGTGPVVGGPGVGANAGKSGPSAEHNLPPGAGGPAGAPTGASTADAGGTAGGGASHVLRAPHPVPAGGAR